MLRAETGKKVFQEVLDQFECHYECDAIIESHFDEQTLDGLD